MLLEQIECFMNRTQHAQRQAVHFEQTQCIDIVFIPLDYRPLCHGCIFDRHQVTQWLMGNNKASRVL